MVSKPIKISEESLKELTKIAGELQAKNGHKKTIDDALQFLIQHYRSHLLGL